tara:strand:- start:76 stop:831 length:756 start_codon:yes stop_codon:yes gene_type:complete
MPNNNSNSNIMTCTICCDYNTTYKILCKCGGDICISCINEVIEIKDTENNSIKDKYRLNYTCPFCKSDNSNIFNHIKLLKNKEFNEMLSKKINNYNENYRNNMDDQIIGYEETIEELVEDIQQLDDVRTKDRLYLSYVEEQSVLSQSKLIEYNSKIVNLEKKIENKDINNKLLKEEIENIGNKLENYYDINAKLKNKIIELEGKIITNNQLNNIPYSDKYHCNICNITINKKSKYNHNKSKKHIQLSNNNI